jgi:AraC-like DNA-binding protein
LAATDLADRKRVSVSIQIEFLELVSKATGDDWIGLTLAENFDLREMGMLYYVTGSSHRLGDALRRLERYARLGNEALVVRIHKGKVCRIGFSYAGVSRHLDRHQIELFASALLRMCRQFVGQRIKPLSASFLHHRQGDLRRVQSVFGCEVQFGARADEISFDAEVMDLPLVGHDPFLNELMLKDCEAALAVRTSSAGPLRTSVENIIGPLLPHGEAQAKTVAEVLGLSERTFARRLASEGLSFGEILDQLRRHLAARHLQEPDLKVSQIAWLLGFGQPSAFSHACRRWFGKAPVEYRRSLSA